MPTTITPRQNKIMSALFLVLLAALAVILAIYTRDVQHAHQILAVRYHSGPLALARNIRYHS